MPCRRLRRRCVCQMDYLAEHADETEEWWRDQASTITAADGRYPIGKAWEPDRKSGFPAPRMIDDPAPVIEFRNCVMRYRPDLRPTMRHISFTVQPGEKIGVCGRTGAGKTTLFYSLFRLAELDHNRLVPEHPAAKLLGTGYTNPATGEYSELSDSLDPCLVLPGCKTPLADPPCKLSEGGVFISGENMRDFKLHDVRRSLCIIPQEPMIFSGSIRRNVDPLMEHDDAEAELC